MQNVAYQSATCRIEEVCLSGWPMVGDELIIELSPHDFAWRPAAPLRRIRGLWSRQSATTSQQFIRESDWCLIVNPPVRMSTSIHKPRGKTNERASHMLDAHVAGERTR
jgi:hypothetical protein